MFALCPVTFQHLIRLMVQGKPGFAGLKKCQALGQFRLTALPIVIPGDGLGAEQQMQVVMPCQ
ncbi:hypothetical protein D3C80_2139340 [compost metagenome]